MADAASGDAKKPPTPKPGLKDVVFSVKTFAAAMFALGFGFAQGFENPYWSALTIYVVVNPPGAGAVRSKSLFRLIGTLIGGALILLAAALFADQLQLLLAAMIGAIVVATFLYRSDRKPTNYISFAVAVTAVAIGVSRYAQPTDLFDLVTARVGEIVFGILVITAVDGVFWPQVMTPPFLKTMVEWRGKVRDWMVGALADRSTEEGEVEPRHDAMRELVKQVIDIDGKGVQLPFDPIALAPRSRHLDLLRAKIVHLVADFGSIEQWAESLRHGGLLRANLAAPLDSVTTWLRETPTAPGSSIDAHVEGSARLAEQLDAARERFDPSVSRLALLEHGLLTRLADFVRNWADLAVVLRAIETGGRLPTRLARQARRVKAVRSVDYAASALDVLPMIVSMAFTAGIWYLTGWTDGLTGTVFSFVACFTLLGQSPKAKMVAGVVGAILVVFVIVLAYEFAILPRVNDFPMLVMVLGFLLLPLGVLMSVNPIGLLLAMLSLALLGLKNDYTYDFEQTVGTMVSSLAGLGIGIFWIRILDYDRARFAARRLAEAARQDVLDVARAPKAPDRERYLSLAVDRVSLFFKSAEQLAKDAPPAHLMGDLSIGNNLLALRRLENDVSPHAQAVIRNVRSEVVHDLTRERAGRPQQTVLDHVVASALEDAAVRRDGAHVRLLDALTGIQLALAGTRPAATAEAPA